MLAIKDLLGFAKSQSDELGGIKAELAALRESVTGIQSAAAGRVAELETQMAAVVTAKDALAVELSAAKTELDATKAKLTEAEAKTASFDVEVDKRASAKARDIVAGLGHDPVKIGASDDPVTARQPESNLKGLDRTRAALEKQSNPKK